MDALETLIAAKRQAISNVEAEIAGHQTELARLRESLKISSIELAAFEKAAELRPTVSNSPPGSMPKGATAATDDDSDTAGGKRRGRQPGSISHAWRKTLGYLHFMGGRFDYEAMLQAAQSAGVNTSLASIRDRARDYVEQGLLEGSPEENFVVSKKAIERFKLDQAPVAGHGGGAPSVDEIEEEEEDDEADAAHDVQPGPVGSGQIPFLDE